MHALLFGGSEGIGELACRIALEAFGDGWAWLVVRVVMFGNRRYFRELPGGERELPDAASERFS